jgi:hypothetical protein
MTTTSKVDRPFGAFFFISVLEKLEGTRQSTLPPLFQGQARHPPYKDSKNFFSDQLLFSWIVNSLCLSLGIIKTNKGYA